VNPYTGETITFQESIQEMAEELNSKMEDMNDEEKMNFEMESSDLDDRE
jgi:hypothetical protein